MDKNQFNEVMDKKIVPLLNELMSIAEEHKITFNFGMVKQIGDSEARLISGRFLPSEYNNDIYEIPLGFTIAIKLMENQYNQELLIKLHELVETMPLKEDSEREVVFSREFEGHGRR